MYRKIVIALSIFLTLLLTVLVYRHFAGDDYLIPDDSKTKGSTATLKPPRRGQRELDIPSGKKFYVERRDKYGRISGIYKADKWKKLSANSVFLTKPQVRIDRRDGQRIYIRAEKGTIFADEVGSGFQPRRGILEGDVRIIVDRWTLAKHPEATSRPPIEKRPRDIVRIFCKDLEFDNEDLTIQTDGAVTLFSTEVDLAGKGLTIQWNQAPSEMTLLRLEQGQYMSINERTEAADSKRPSAGAGKTIVTVKPTRITGRPRAGGGLKPVAVSPAKKPRRPKQPKARNRYRAVFNGDVQVHSGERSMKNAQKLSLMFEWETTSKRRDEKSRKIVKPQAIKTPVSAGGRATPAPKPPRVKTELRQSGKKFSEPIVITWSGPLVIKPSGYVEKPDSRRYKIRADGKRIAWISPEGAAVCSKFTLSQPQQVVEMEGSSEVPVRLALTDGQQIVCEKARLDQKNQKIILSGVGSMVRVAKKDSDIDAAFALILAEAGMIPATGDQISWKKDMVANLGEEKVVRPDGSTKTRLFIKDATFRQQVTLVQAQTDDFVQCDELRLWMVQSRAAGRSTGTRPSKAVARGHVKARQAGSNIFADNMAVTFDESLRKKKAGREKQWAVRPATLSADGNVRIVDRRDGEITRVFADSLQSDLVARKAILKGRDKLARIVQGDNSLHGREIHFDQTDESVIVNGRGKLCFQTDKDMDGRALAQPRPIEVAWVKHMNFHGKRNEATFKGDVTLASGFDSMSCQDMHLTFAKVPVTTKPTTRAATSNRIGLALATQATSRRRLAEIVCRDKVILARRRLDQRGRLLERLRLTGQHLTYEAQNGEMNVIGPGTMSAENYDKPKGKAAMKRAEWPLQTVFLWKRRMRFSRDDREAVLDGDVVMRYRSGNKIVLVKKLNILPIPKLKSGRKTSLDCDRLVASFSPRTQATATKPTTKPMGVSPGQLQRIVASGNVNLHDGPQRVIGDRLDYDRKNGIIVVLGKKSLPATLIYESAPGARPRTVQSSKIRCLLRDNRIIRVDTSEVTGW